MKTAVKKKTGATLRISLKMCDRNDLPHKLLLTTRQKKLINAFNNNMLPDIKLSKVHIFKIIQSGWFLGSLLIKLAGPLMKVAALLTKHILAPLGITAAAEAIDAEIQKKMNDIMEIVQALEDSNILLKGVTKTIKTR